MQKVFQRLSRWQFDRYDIIAWVLLAALVGLGVIQYRFLVAGLQLARLRFDQHVATELAVVRAELTREGQLSGLVAAAVCPEAPQRFTVSQDTVRDAAAHFLGVLLDRGIRTTGQAPQIAYALELCETIRLQSPDYATFAPPYNRYEISLDGYLAQACGCRPRLLVRVGDLVQPLLAGYLGLLVPALALLLVAAGSGFWQLQLLRRRRRLDTLKNDFINNLTHEFKTPVFAISLAGHLLGETLTDAQQRRYLDTIRSENDKLKQHVDQLLRLASVAQRGDVIDLRPADPRPLLDALASETAAAATGRGGQFVYDPLPKPLSLRIDPAHLSHAVRNLLENALKYSPDPPQIALRSYLAGRYYVIAVSDCGVGIPVEAQRHIFDSFYRVAQGDLHVARGMGLGLSYARQVAELHGGRIAVESQPGRGSTFTLYLPCVQDR
ncbi:MAG: hypothetical protein OHK0039_33550 [Bacteroidia bacterium]